MYYERLAPQVLGRFQPAPGHLGREGRQLGDRNIAKPGHSQLRIPTITKTPPLARSSKEGNGSDQKTIFCLRMRYRYFLDLLRYWYIL